MICSEISLNIFFLNRPPPYRIFTNYLRFSQISFKGISFVAFNPWLVRYVMYQSLSGPIPYRSLGGPFKIYTVDGWGGMGSDGRGFKSVLQRSLFSEGIQMYISTYICNKKLSLSCLMVSKLEVDMGSQDLSFKTPMGNCFKQSFKSKVFQKNKRLAFF